MHPFPELAKKVVEAYCKDRVIPDPPEPLPAEMQRSAGVFVSLKKHGALRGCIGTFSPTTGNLALEIIRNARAAANEDPRFNPVSVHELNQIDYSVDVLSAPVKIQSLKELDPKKYGVIVVKGSRKGLLLPDLEGVDTVEYQLSIARTKAGIDAGDSDVEIFKFTVDRYR
ncbi:MAG TPA: AmmeMemoRadiSam system protein A [Dissulfurispiraceae bacterium]|nr:AmmeMemoRadiSam system protein A [Dissulfurispiraceae bacterium]